MSKNEIEFGHCTVDDFIQYMNERHRIWRLRFIQKLDKPWTNDPTLQQYKFTNVFRQLDRGTIALRKMLRTCPNGNRYDDPILIFFNIVWYRYFNLDVHAKKLGFIENYQQVEDFIIDKAKKGKRIFTGAWMTTGVLCEDKHITYLRACKEAWNSRAMLVERIKSCNSLEKTSRILTELYMVGKFLAYEIACDLRFTSLLNGATDKLTWANMGPGAKRGLCRLGMPYKNQQEGCESMRSLFDTVRGSTLLDPIILNENWPFELREVEHNLCEFDKYQRVKLGEGRPRSKYPGV
jgi:hypothetical protein